MFWQKKEEGKSLPDLPPAKKLSIMSNPATMESLEDNDDETDISERHSLPSFPDSPTMKGFSQSIIKDAVNPSEDDKHEEFDSSMDSKAFKTIEMDDWSDKKEDSKGTPSILSPPSESKILAPPVDKFTPPAKTQKSSDLFVKIDKFYSAKRSLESTKSKLREIDEVLKKIRETRLREDQELTSWEKEMNNIKVRIKEVNENLFEKIE